VIRRTLTLLAVLSLAAPLSLHAQEVAEELRDAMKSEVFNLEMLFRTDAELRLEDGGERSHVDVAVARLRARGRLDGGFQYFAQFEFARDPNVLDLRLGWSPGTEFLVRAGRFKTPFSREFLTFFGARDLNGTARIVGRLAPNRQYGVEMSGRASDHFRWQVGGFTGGSSSASNEPGLVVGRVVFDRLFASESGSGVSLGLNAGAGTDQAIAQRLYGSGFRGDGTLVGVDARYERGPLLLSTEWIRGDYESDLHAPGDGEPQVIDDSGASGIQVTAAWQFTDVVQGLIRWDRFDGPDSAADDLMLLGLNITPTDYVRMQAIYRLPFEDASETHRMYANIQLFF